MRAFLADFLYLLDPVDDPENRSALFAASNANANASPLSSPPEDGNEKRGVAPKFKESTFLTSFVSVNASLIDAVFYELSGGMHAPRTLFHRNHLASTTPSLNGKIGYLTFEAVLRRVAMEEYRFAYVITGSDVEKARRAYASVASNAQDVGFLKRAFLRRLAARVTYSSLVAEGTISSVTKGMLQNFVSSVENLPLIKGYISLYDNIHLHLNGTTGTVSTSSVSERGKGPEKFYDDQRKDLQRWCITATVAPSFPPVDALNARLSKTCADKDDDMYRHCVLPPYMTKYEYIVACFAKDGYFLRRFHSTAVTTDPVWLHVSFDNPSDKMHLSWMKDIVRGKVARRKNTVFVTTQNKEQQNQDQNPLLPAFHACLGRVFRNGKRLTISTTNGDHQVRVALAKCSHDDDAIVDERYLGSYGCPSPVDDDTSDMQLRLKWWDDIVAQALRLRLDASASLDAEEISTPHVQQTVTAKSAFYDFMLNYIASHGIVNFSWRNSRRENNDQMVNETSKPSGNKYDYCVVLVDNRSDNSLGLASLLIALHNVAKEQMHDPRRPRRRWGAYVFCGEANESYTKRCLLPHFELPEQDLNIVCLPELSCSNEFVLEDYNALLKSPAFWERISARKCLLVQDDGILVRPGVEARYMDRYDYVGAPWLEGQAVLQGATNPDLVGNGGLSIRGTQAMIDISRAGERRMENYDLFVNGAQSIPEDVYFARGVYLMRDRYALAPREEAVAFSSEQVLSPSSLGFHKPWPYHPLRDIVSFFERILSEKDTEGTVDRVYQESV
jgi:hypothetical protein